MKNEREPEGSVEPRDDARLSAYVLAELAAEERARLEPELARDPELAAEARALAGLAADLRDALGGSTPLRLDAQRRAQVLRAAARERAAARAGLGRRLAVAAGVLSLVGAAGWLSMRELRERSAADSSPFAYAIGGGSATAVAPLQALGYGGDSEVPSPLGTEDYAPITESAFRDAEREPLSTFAIDVDTASYANVRRFLNEGRLPPADAVRIEELVNSFRYDYPEPRGPGPFSVHIDGASAPWRPEHRLVRIGLRTRAPDLGAPRVKNLVFLVDVSGSMNHPAKLPLVQRSLRLLVDELSPEDRVALVVYAGNSGLVLPSTSVDARAEIHAAIEALRAGGSTNGGSGIQLAYRTAREHFAAGGVNRVILATDGDFNVGVTDRSELLRLIQDEAQSGVFLSVLGFGTGNLKDATMEMLADHGNGNYAYVDSLAEARKVLVRELGATLETVAKDVKIQVEFNPAQVAAWRLIGYENRLLAARDFDDDQRDAGEIGAGHTVTALYEIVPAAARQVRPEPLRYQDRVPQAGAAAGELLRVQVRYKQPEADTSELLSATYTDQGLTFAAAAPDLRFAASVAAFGLCLRASPARGTATLAEVHRWAEAALAGDPRANAHGDGDEFLRLVERAASLAER